MAALKKEVYINVHCNSTKPLDELLQAKDMMDSAMTYTLFEFAKENGDDIAIVPLAPTQVSMIRTVDTYAHTHTHTRTYIQSFFYLCTHTQPSKASVQPVKVKKEKKEILTKSAKRRLAGRLSK